jgi:hypothetical protein
MVKGRSPHPLTWQRLTQVVMDPNCPLSQRPRPPAVSGNSITPGPPDNQGGRGAPGSLIPFAFGARRVQRWGDGRVQAHPGVPGVLDDRHQQLVIEYLQEEIRVSREQQGSGRLRFTREQRLRFSTTA